jgi:O-succinylhomoserine sulfhydrylase
MADGADLPEGLRPDTLAVRAGLQRSGFHETAEALFLTSGYVYGSAQEAADAFAGRIDRHRYSRVSNPTVDVLQDRVAALEGGEAARALSSGMAAVFHALLACTRAGDRVVASRSLFGSCFVIVDELLPRYGVETVLVDGHDLEQWEAALEQPTAAVFFESPSNPMQELVDIAAVAELAHAVGATVIVDNAFVSPVLQRPLELGADVVTYSTTKHMDGQGRTLGGLVVGSREWIDEQLVPIVRHTGPALSPFNAWVVTKGLETLSLRVGRMSDSALLLAQRLEAATDVAGVRHPWLESHPQHELARRQMSGGGTVVTFELDGGTERAFALLDALRLVDISNNFADAKSLVTHPATTTHHRIGAEARALVGITDGTVRLSVGLEDPEDLWDDLERALGA